MSRTTAGIMRINQELDKISGLDGIVADKIEELEKYVKEMVSDILNNHSEASIFTYSGNLKNEKYKIFDSKGADSELAKYDGCLCEITRELTEEEADINEVGKMYHIKFIDGYETDAFADELSSIILIRSKISYKRRNGI